MSIRTRNSSLVITCSLTSSLHFPRQKKVYSLTHERFPTVEAECLLKRCNVHSKPKYAAMSIRTRNSSLLITCSLTSSLPLPRQKKVYTLAHDRFPIVEAACLLKRCNVYSNPKYAAMSIRSRNSSLLITCSLTSSLPFPRQKKVYSLLHERFLIVVAACLLKRCNVHSNPKYAAMSIRSRNSSLLITCSLTSSLSFPRQKKVYSLPHKTFPTVEAACLLKRCNVHSNPKYAAMSIRSRNSSFLITCSLTSSLSFPRQKEVNSLPHKTFPTGEAARLLKLCNLHSKPNAAISIRSRGSSLLITSSLTSSLPFPRQKKVYSLPHERFPTVEAACLLKRCNVHPKPNAAMSIRSRNSSLLIACSLTLSLPFPRQKKEYSLHHERFPTVEAACLLKRCRVQSKPKYAAMSIRSRNSSLLINCSLTSSLPFPRQKKVYSLPHERFPTVEAACLLKRCNVHPKPKWLPFPARRKSTLSLTKDSRLWKPHVSRSAAMSIRTRNCSLLITCSLTWSLPFPRQKKEYFLPHERFPTVEAACLLKRCRVQSKPKKFVVNHLLFEIVLAFPRQKKVYSLPHERFPTVEAAAAISIRSRNSSLLITCSLTSSFPFPRQKKVYSLPHERFPTVEAACLLKCCNVHSKPKRKSTLSLTKDSRLWKPHVSRSAAMSIRSRSSSLLITCSLASSLPFPRQKKVYALPHKRSPTVEAACLLKRCNVHPKPNAAMSIRSRNSSLLIICSMTLSLSFPRQRKVYSLPHKTYPTVEAACLLKLCNLHSKPNAAMSIRSRNSSLLITCSLTSSFLFPRQKNVYSLPHERFPTVEAACLLNRCNVHSKPKYQKKVYSFPHERFPTVEAACLLNRCNVHSRPKYAAISIRSRNSSLLITCSLTSSLPFPARRKCTLSLMKDSRLWKPHVS
ncbi:unnamed protein product [Acanthosepion pharaonis]|uniref:Uncharacterized protein n=1 Tax=Acanthosepion pharaonis TaxID=158019 RepID=A0A812BWS0_ACAPH|nr:unnamed protein product [Sepia pharaonis]